MMLIQKAPEQDGASYRFLVHLINYYFSYWSMMSEAKAGESLG